MECQRCHSKISETSSFCSVCGYDLSRTGPENAVDTGRISELAPPASLSDGERKQVTVLFSDLAGFTAMSESLDPEEVRDLMRQIFSKTAQVVVSYEGNIEKYVGDAVMAVFGLHHTREDDVVRAIMAAQEIHRFVEGMSPGLEQKLGRSLAMHTGINTGLVIIGEVDLKEGVMGVIGDTVNVASRLKDLATPGEIVIGQNAYALVEKFYDCEGLPPSPVKGKTEPLLAYKVLAARGERRSGMRFSGLRAKLIGRRVERAILEDAVDGVRDGQSALITICGEAGIGKSRLVKEFKVGRTFNQSQWLEGSAHDYSHGIPYFPFIDLLNHTWKIEEGDPPQQVREKIESNMRVLGDSYEAAVPYIGSLYSLESPEVEGSNPESWKHRLHEALKEIFEAMISQGTKVIYMEDLHWADPSSLDLLRYLSREVEHPAVFLCSYRPPFRLFPSGPPQEMESRYREIFLNNLSQFQIQDMVNALLGEVPVPSELIGFLEEKSGGNPFYLEEMLTSLIESNALVRDNGNWKFVGLLDDFHVPPTVQGVISARLDRLETGSKKLLQEASVIGRTFLQVVLKQTTEVHGDVVEKLGNLERTDLIHVRAMEPDVEYLFKHSLTQDVVYGSLLRRERQTIHERVGTVIEHLMRSRLAEFYERLAYHFREAQAFNKAVDYLIKAGEKSLNRYSLDEAHQFFQEAYDLLAPIQQNTEGNAGQLIGLLNKWALVYYFSGRFTELNELLSTHTALAESLEDKSLRGMFITWLATGLWVQEQYRESYHYLVRALELGQQIGERRLTALACAQLSWACAELGLLQEGVAWGEKAQILTQEFPSDDFLYHFVMGGSGYVQFLRGDRKETLAISEKLLEFGRRQSSNYCLAYGYLIGAGVPYIAGDYQAALDKHDKVIEITMHPIIYTTTKAWQGFSLVMMERYPEAEAVLEEALSFSGKFGFDYVKSISIGALGVVFIAKGEMNRGMRMLKYAVRTCFEKERRVMYAQFEYVLGRVYSQLASRSQPIGFSLLLRNLGFLLKHFPFAAMRAKAHLTTAAEVAREIGAESLLALSCLELGLLYQAKQDKVRARECLDEAVVIFQRNEAESYLDQARQALAALD